MAADSQTSLGYSAGHHIAGWERSSIGDSPYYLSLVEVVAGAGTFQPFLVVANEELVSTRFLFVFPQHSNKAVAAAELAKEMTVFPFEVKKLHAHIYARSLDQVD